MTINELTILLGKLKMVLGDDAEVEFQNIEGEGEQFTEMPIEAWEARPGKVLLKG